MPLQWRFRGLGAFAPGPLDEELIGEVWGDSPEEAERALDTLAGCGVLESRGKAEQLFLPGYIQQHALWRLSAEGEAEVLGLRHAEAVLAQMGADEARCRAGGLEARIALDRFAESWPQIAEAGDYLAGRDDIRSRGLLDAFLAAAPTLLGAAGPTRTSRNLAPASPPPIGSTRTRAVGGAPPGGALGGRTRTGRR